MGLTTVGVQFEGRYFGASCMHGDTFWVEDVFSATQGLDEKAWKLSKERDEQVGRLGLIVGRDA